MKGRALFGVLALAPGLSMPRSQLCALFWGESPDSRARGNLRQVLHELRGELGPLWPVVFAVDHHQVGLRGEAVEIDVLDFLRDASSPGAEALLRADAVFRGELLADVELGAPSFEDWLQEQRSSLRERAITVQEGLLARRLGSMPGPKLIALDPLREASHRILMARYAERGEAALALRQFDECQALLRRQLGIEVAPETRRLRDEIACARDAVPAPSPMRARAALPGVAVLPFAADPRDDEARRMGDDLAADLTTELSRYRSVRVIGPAMAGIDPASREAAGEAYVLTGRVRRGEGRFRVSVQLVERVSRQTIWGERFDGSAAATLSFHDQIVAQVVARAEGHLVAREHGGRAAQSERGTRAYDYVLRGRFALHNSRVGDAGPLLRHAVELEPSLSDAHAHLAIQLVAQSWDDPLPAPGGEAAAHAQLAIEADPFNPLAHASLGFVLQYGGSLEAAGPAYEKALSLNPNDVRILTYAGMWHTYMGEPGKGLELLERVLARASYPTPGYWSIRANTLFQCGDYRAARACLERGTKLEAWDLPYLLAALGYLGDAESLSRVKAVLLSETNADRGGLMRQAEYEPYRRLGDKRRFIDGLRLALSSVEGALTA